MVKLTEAGTVFYNDAKEILSKIDIAGKRVQKMADQNISFLKIGCSSNAELESFQDVLYDLHEKFPNTYPQIIVQDYFKLKNLFHNRQLDIMLATKEMIRDMKGCSFKKLKEVKNYAVLSDKSPLKTENTIRFEDLKDECLITLHPKFIPFQYGNKLQEKITLHSQNHFNISCENDQTGILLAKCGYGAAILPGFCLPRNLDGLVSIPIIDENCNIDYGMAYQKNTQIDYIRYFINNMSKKLYNR